MSCVICLEEGAGFVCECSAFHVHCFATFLVRGDDECQICHSRFDRRLKAAALDPLSTRTSHLFGEANPTTKVRQLELAVAFADIGQIEVAKLCLQNMYVSPQTNSLVRDRKMFTEHRFFVTEKITSP